MGGTGGEVKEKHMVVFAALIARWMPGAESLTEQGSPGMLSQLR
jgi:hypothetical protein